MCVCEKIVALIKQGGVRASPGLARGLGRGQGDSRGKEGAVMALQGRGHTHMGHHGCHQLQEQAPSPLLAPPALSPQAKPRLSAELMGLGELMLTNKRARPNARD